MDAYLLSAPVGFIDSIAAANSLAETDPVALLALLHGAAPSPAPSAAAAALGVPPERLSALRAAFTATMNDKVFLEDAQKSKLDIQPQTGEEVQRFVEATYASPPEVVERAKKVLGR